MKQKLLGLVALAALPCATLAQINDPFNSLDPAWIPNRHDSAGFGSVSFDGDNRLRLTLDQTGSTANRLPEFSSSFYSIQGRQRAGGITGLWSLSAEVYIASAFNTTTGPLAGSELWGHTGTTPSGGDYLTLGFTNASPTDAFNPVATDRTFRFQLWDGSADAWIDLGVPLDFAFNAWHTLAGTSTGTTFEYYIDGALVYTKATTAGMDLLDAMIQGYNYDEAGSYSVYWDNVSASAIPEPATGALLAALAALGLIGWRRSRRVN